MSALFFSGVSESITPRTKLESKQLQRVIESPQNLHLFGQLMSVCPSAKPHILHFRHSAITKESLVPDNITTLREERYILAKVTLGDHSVTLLKLTIARDYFLWQKFFQVVAYIS